MGDPSEESKPPQSKLYTLAYKCVLIIKRSGYQGACRVVSGIHHNPISIGIWKRKQVGISPVKDCGALIVLEERVFFSQPTASEFAGRKLISLHFKVPVIEFVNV